ncbi:hypothetical protein [Flavobacterium restrictum]|uniref:Uncharacterized protein n=1 Tax=Flavobacterium restrictum TaxID=2594428 RepID=A0A553DW85_9FLAO|nr:hypothetical protein [Flavobacterium restrictum]TRX37041.1 hypothetical protein FNW21_12665 [Flavobacterium restrictum]
MKKRLEADLISIAHRILQLKNKSDINLLFLETQKLYEKLAVLKFVEENLGEIKPTIGQVAVENEIEIAFYKKEAEENEPKTAAVILEEEVILPEAVLETEKEIVTLEENSTLEPQEIEATAIPESVIEIIEPSAATFIPSFEFTPENEVEVIPEIVKTPEIKKPEVVQISFEDLLGGNYNDTHFVKVNTLDTIPTAIAIETPIEMAIEEKEIEEPKSIPLNEKLVKGISIDLNDRIGFVKHLFGNSSEDYNRVLNQLITFDTFQETKLFIDEMVKPDYNNWSGKDDYADRFMEIIEKKFL